MTDFFQAGVITTLHRLKKVNLERMEMELEFYSRSNPIALILPSLYSELKEQALKTIISEIQKVKYLNEHPTCVRGGDLNIQAFSSRIGIHIHRKS